MKGFLAPYLQDIAILKQNQLIMVNLKELISHLVGVRLSLSWRKTLCAHLLPLQNLGVRSTLLKSWVLIGGTLKRL
jgi:hypothetical protein